MSKVSLELIPGRDGKLTWGRKDEEYIADFCLIARRALDDSDYKLFRFHFLLGADWKLCTRRLKIDRGSFFHAVYRIEQKLGLAFRETQPYSLYPLDEYFHGTFRQHPQPVAAASSRWFHPRASVGDPLRPPLLKTA